VDRLLEATARAEDRHFWFKGLRRFGRRALAEAIPAGSVRLIVDSGTGTGRNLEWLASFGPAVGVERSPAGLAAGRSRGRRMVGGSAAQLPIASDAADVVTAFDVLTCVDNGTEAAAARELHRILKPGGIALVNVAAFDFLRGKQGADVREHRRYTPARLRTLLESAGFTIERMTFTNMLTFPVTLAARVGEMLRPPSTQSFEALHVPAAPINATLNGLLTLDDALLRWVNLPVGSSILCVARKPR
jgi:SAM-dependent methyltransferase